ncbi:MAG TPA: hypothetical protein VE954_14810 [Oligoflexus sp.]|uniref:hypothetical protein n=1 Tax=Oligoflexus sp. TaxID=1971216 RepID=UPI002D5713A6|nr:hypothetical protein [Oligoflexus sp.]HYX34372.1 hypothetical protein [Oligoflexus sp.]
MAVKAARIWLKGKLSDQISWNVLYRAEKSALERYWLSNKVNDNLDVSIGLQKLKIYGWGRRLASGANSPILGQLLVLNPSLPSDSMAIDIVYKLAGTLSLTFIKDYYDTKAPCGLNRDDCKSWNKFDQQKQPAINFEWAGSFGSVQPLIQYGVYDIGKSSILTAGMRFKMDNLESHADYTVDTRLARGKDSAGLVEEQKETVSGMVIYGEYKLGNVSPFLLVSTLGVEQFTAPGGTQTKINTDGKIDDNGQTLGLGAFFEHWGSIYRPYTAVSRISGKYKNAATAAEEDRSRTDLMVGLVGKF